MDFVEAYYRDVIGLYPFDNDDNKIKSQKVIDYLVDAGISKSEILSFVENAPSDECLRPEMLPENFWEGSLLKKDTFYFHNRLHITSKPPMWDPLSGKEIVEKFYLEMKIRFTMEDLIGYFYSTLEISRALMDIKRDTGSFNYFLDKFKKFSFIEPIDFVLRLIDVAKDNEEERRIFAPLDLATYEAKVYEYFIERVEIARIQKVNKIVWR